MKCFLSVVGTVLLAGAMACVHAIDWPQWRYDEYRSASSPETLPPALHLEWTRQYSPRTQVWDDPLNNDLMSYDMVFEPVVVGQTMFVGFNDADKVVALDIATGRELWAFYTEGPVRLPPVAGSGRVYFASDDGHLYCVRGDNGQLVWKFRGAPNGRKALGNGRVISAWPARGGPVLRDGQVYFAASIWPFMGTFIYALDARTGAVVWVNDGTGAQYIKQPHSAPAFAGVAPQGPIVATRELLLIPGGRSVPAAFDRRTGDFLYYHLDEGGKGNGGSFVAATESEFYVHTRLRGTRSFDLKTGKKGTFIINEPVLAGDIVYSAQEHSKLQAAVIEAEAKLTTALQAETDARTDMAKALEDASNYAYKKATNALATAWKKVATAKAGLAEAQTALSNAWAGPVLQAVGKDKKVLWELPIDGSGDLIKAGQRLYAANTNSISAIDLGTGKGQPSVAWTLRVGGHVCRLLAANGKLFAVTTDGRIMAFGNSQTKAVTLTQHKAEKPLSPAATARAQDILAATAAPEGYALWFGVDDGQVLQAVVRNSKLHITAADPDAARIERLRRELDAAGLYGTRVTLHVGDARRLQYPPYIANLVVVGDSMLNAITDTSVLEAVYQSVRPFGGTLWLSASAGVPEVLSQRLTTASLPGLRRTTAPRAVVLVREGAPPGSANWTHQYGDIGNTLKSDDRLVRLPLGVLWFGGNTHMDVLPRHGHGPSEQVAAGRLFIEGMSSLSARDVYTGRVLWKNEYSDLGNYGVYYDSSYTNLPLTIAYNQKHIPGANARGANYVALEDAVYLVAGQTCRVLDARDGKMVQTFRLPAWPGEAEPPEWGYLGVADNVLLAGAGFAHYSTRHGLSTNRNPGIIDLSASRGLVALDRHSGKVLWSHAARQGFIHNGIVAGNGRVYALDKMPSSIESRLRRRGRSTPKDYRIVALDLATGNQLWQTETNIFGTWLSYSKVHDVLLQAGAAATDRLRDEAERGMLAYRGASGETLWQNLSVRYNGPCILHNEMILTTPGSYKTNSGAFNLLDGKPRLVDNPVTRQKEPLKVYRTYGCNYPVACENVLTFRSGAAGFYDLETHSGTGNLGGFKSGCSPNLIAANGVLNAPDYTRTCSCAYQNQTSLALVHMPDLEVWTHNQFGVGMKPGQRIERVGINLGAPGDRRAPSGTLWIEHPRTGGSSPQVPVTVQSSSTNFYRRHASQFGGQGPAWVMASGFSGAGTILLAPETRRPLPPPPAPKKKPGDDDDDDDDEDTNGTNGTNGTKVATAPAPAPATNHVEPAYKSSLPPAPYTVRLYFAEPENLRLGDRVFDVLLQGRAVLKNFDVLATAGGPRVGLVRDFPGILIGEDLAVELRPVRQSRRPPILSGVEIILEQALASQAPLAAGN